MGDASKAERQQAATLKWRRANRAKVRSAAKKWRVANRDKDSEAARKYYAANQEKMRAAQKRYRSANAAKLSAYQRKRKYGIEANVPAMLAAQGGKCACCATTLLPGKDTCADHCHETGLIRGLLCRKCNLAIGLVADSPETLDNMAAYLRKAQT